MTSDAHLELRLLGGFEARLASGTALVLPAKKTQALIAYLALASGKSHPREQLATLLWGDMSRAHARGNLRKALSTLNKILPKAVRASLVVDGPSVSLDPLTVDVDVARFERLVADGGPDALGHASVVYRGPLLDGLVLGERAFEEWLTAERERLHELAIQCLTRLFTYQRQADAHEPAIRTGLRLLALDPLQEPVHRALMRLHARLGSREAALRQYQHCVEALKHELNAPPEAETTHLYRQILNTPSLASGESPDIAAASGGVEAPRPAALTNLPVASSELIGRDGEARDVVDLIARHRLVTLTGVGGIGKTRLSLEVARQLLPDFVDGVWLVELAPLSDPRLVPVGVAVALELALPDRAESPERVAAALREKRLLLLLDNCEHVIDAAARLVDAVLRGAPSVRVLATSREPLRAPGEHVHRVPPLEVPREDTVDREQLLHTAAVRLFMARARSADARFSPDARAAAIAAALCRRLDGIPLAIELAAARTAALGLDELAERLDDRLRLLTVGHRTALPRQQTLRATLDWSHELLPITERTALRRLAVLIGSFTLEAATAVSAADDLDASDVVEVVSNLAAKSLIVVEIANAGTHYRLLETTRIYALQKLAESGELDEVARRHAQHYKNLLDQAGAEWVSRPTPEWLALYGRHLDNVRTALDWAFSPGGDASIGVALTAAALPIWFLQSLLLECRGRVERALASLANHPARDTRSEMALRAALLVSLIHTEGAAPGTIGMLAGGLDFPDGHVDAGYQLPALWSLWLFRIRRGEARTALLLAQKFSDLVANQADRLVGERMMATAHHFLGYQTTARRMFEAVLSGYGALPRPPCGRSARHGHPLIHPANEPLAARMTLSRILWLQGFPERARQLAERTVADAMAADHAVSICFALETACLVAIWSGDLLAAERHVTAMRDYSARHALAEHDREARCFNGARLIQRGDCAEGLEVLGSAPDQLQATSSVPFYPFMFGTLAHALSRAGNAPQALATIDEALGKCERDEERWWIAELLRLKAQAILAAEDTDAGAAEIQLQDALAWARKQGALSLELRCATDLARLWLQQRQAGPARDLLASIYARFTEGFATADLEAAKALLVSTHMA